jgi:hypothetical protein
VTKIQKSLAIASGLVVAIILAIMLLPDSIKVRLLYGMQQTTQRELERAIASRVHPGRSAEEVLDFLDSQLE